MADERKDAESSRITLSAQAGEVMVARFVDRVIVDDSQVQMIRADLFGLVDGPAKRKLVLDFANIDYLSSMVLPMISSLNQRLQAVNGWLALTNVSKPLFELFETTNLNRSIKLLPDAAALKRFLDDDRAAAESHGASSEDTPFTDDELRQIEADGITLGDAIRAIESSME